VFGVARGDLRFPSIASRAEDAFRAEDYVRAARVLSAAPGAFLRALDRMLRGATGAQQEEIVTLATVAMKSASGRVLLSLREHLMNRFTPDAARVFVGRTKRAWVTPDERAPLQMGPVSRLADAIDGELIDRMPVSSHLVVDPAVLDMALPLSGKASAAGFEVLPRGSRSHIVAEPGDSLRFFTYWREEARRTDYDLSLLMLGEDFSHAGFVSWTNYSDEGVFYSGDIVASPNGATEFIDVRLDMVRPEVHYLVPQVNIYCGESFEEVAESMFGWMLRNEEQRGMPFEARTVRTRSEMRGTGQVALPIVFARNDDGTWSAVWTHLYLQGQTGFNRVEGNRLSTGLLAQGIVGRRYLNMEYLLALRSRVAAKAELWTPGMKLDGPVTFVGREAPEGLPEGSEVFAGDRLTELIPG
jgi:stress response protein SCP2